MMSLLGNKNYELFSVFRCQNFLMLSYIQNIYFLSENDIYLFACFCLETLNFRVEIAYCKPKTPLGPREC